MAKACANIADINKFSQSISRQKESVYTVRDSFYSALSDAETQIIQEKNCAEDVLNRCAQAIQALQSKIEELENKLASLEAELAATPQTITVTSTDSEGNTSEEEVPNPAYQALLGEISACQAKLGELQTLMGEFQQLQAKVNEQKDRLDQALQRMQELLESFNESIQRLGGIAESTLEKLKRIENTLQEYLSVKINAPTLSGGGGVTLASGQGNYNPSSVSSEAVSSSSTKPKGPLSDFNEHKLEADDKFDGLSISDVYLSPFGKNQSNKVQKQFDEVALEHAKGLSFEERSAIQDYTREEFEGVDYKGINKSLRKPEEYNNDSIYQRERIRRDIEILTQCIDKRELPSDTVLYRGVGDMNAVFGMDMSLPVEELREKYIGQAFIDRGFGSTSIERSTAESFATKENSGMMTINAPTSTKGFVIGSVGSFGNKENEVLLQRGSIYMVTDIVAHRVTGSVKPFYEFKVDLVGTGR